MIAQRPDPDALLARLNDEEQRHSRGRLKIFFGMAAGVGKTYAMLQAAQERNAEGVDVLAGYVEPHGRAETEALLEGLEVLPPRIVEYRGTTLREFDLDAALARKPELVLVDELAHTNAEGSRHAKRYQDVEELLGSGIDVYTTVNVQHIESLNDVVAQITGVLVRETVPDRVLDDADAVELIDLTPDDLLQRLRDGKVYVPQQAERAIGSFFRKGNLHALRELALRKTAERVNAQMEAYRATNAIQAPWPAAERLLVGVSSSPQSAQLVRAGRRMAAGLRAAWVVANVETAGSHRLADADREQLVQTLRLAEQLGAETVSLSGANVSEELLAYAQRRNINRIVVGKPGVAGWRARLFGSPVDALVRRSGAIDVYVVSGEGGERVAPSMDDFQTTSPAQAYLLAPAAVALASGLAAVVDNASFGEANVIMVYLLAVLLVALSGGRGPSVLASVLSVVCFNFFFVDPRLTFAVSDTRYLITFGTMLLVGLVVGTLMARFRSQAATARERERRTAALYTLSRELAGAPGFEQLLRAAVHNTAEVFASQVVVLLPISSDRLQPWGTVAGWARQLDARLVYAPSPSEQGVAQWAFAHGELAGRGTNTLPASEALYLPLIGAQRTVGVLGVRPGKQVRLNDPEQLHLLEAFANQTALAIERTTLEQEAKRSQVAAEAERMRAALLSSVSHDLRTPLAVITGASSTLAQADARLDPATRIELAQTVYEEGERLTRLVANLLAMTRLDGGAIQVHKAWQLLDEVVGTALARLESSPDMRARVEQHPLAIEIAPDLPPVPIDEVLLEQVLLNLLENALKYTPPGTPIAIRARRNGAVVEVDVADEGPGIPPGDEERVFDKFYRANAPESRSSVGLGLAICRGMIEAHGGRIWVEPQQRGALFRLTLPLEGMPDAALPGLPMQEQRL